MIKRYYETEDDIQLLFLNSNHGKLLEQYVLKESILSDDDVVDIQLVLNMIINSYINVAYRVYNKLDTFAREFIIDICERSYN